MTHTEKPQVEAWVGRYARKVTMMFRQKKTEDPCVSCDRMIKPGQKSCKCGAPTKYMDFDERREHEVQAWRQYRQAAAAS